jgi:hypothetical protein
MTMCLELISAHGQVNVTLERVMVQDMVTQVLNPSYLGRGDQKDCGLRPARAKS